jgi:uncharacterized protein YoaH (UPF0181 family)
MMATAPTTPRHPATGRRGAAVRRASGVVGLTLLVSVAGSFAAVEAVQRLLAVGVGLGIAAAIVVDARRAYRDALDVAARQLGTTWGVGRG